MKKIIFSILIIILIFFTSIIKNSTKKIDVKIFDLKEDLRLLNEKYELIDHDENTGHWWSRNSDLAPY